MSPLRALGRALQRFFARRRAQRLTAQALPRGLPKALLGGPAHAEPGPLDYPALPLFAQTLRGRAPRRLLRLSALPPERPDLLAGRVLPALRLELTRAPKLPAQLQLAALLAPRAELPTLRPLAARVLPAQRSSLSRPLHTPKLLLDRPRRDLGAARPDRLRLDVALTLPPERDPTVTTFDRAPLAPEHHAGPRTPLARAPLTCLALRAFRLDPQTGQIANQCILPLERNSPEYWWVPAAFRALYLDPRWMEQNRLRFLGPTQTEWFVLWWEQIARKKPGARTAIDYLQPDGIYWLMQECKEQLLIRRDVKKDEQPPKEQEFFYIEEGVAIFQAEPPEMVALIPAVSWVEKARLAPTVDLDANPAREAYLQWRTLVGALEER